MGYQPRLVDEQLRGRLASAGAVLLEGAKACGKTETARQQAHSIVQFDTDQQVPIQMDLDPFTVLQGATPRLLDEWQEYPNIWNYVRREIDSRKEKGQFILTGSATPTEDVRRHSGAGRFSQIRMRTMSLQECGWSTGEISLSQLFQDTHITSNTVDFSLESLVQKLSTGGWPDLIGSSSLQDAQLFSRDYINQIAHVSTSFGERRRNPIRLRRLLNSLARNIASETSLTALAQDTGGNESPMSIEAVRGYLDSLESLMIIEPQPAWNTHIRSSDTLRKAAKWHFVDPSLAIGSLELSAEKLSNNLNYLGMLFESLVIRDLRIYADLLGGKIFHYRDSRGVEVDAIVETPDGEWMAIEVKLGMAAADAAAANLLTFAQKIDTEKVPKPCALIVITANGFAHRRKDGVLVIPISTLGA